MSPNTPASPRDAVIVAYRRTPFGRARKGSLATERPEDLALAAVAAVLAELPTLDVRTIDDLILGTAVPEGAQGDNFARRVAVLAGHDEIAGVTVNRFCASSLEALAMAARAVRSGDGDAYLVVGAESTSSQPPTPSRPYPGGEDAAARVDYLLDTRSPWTDPRDSGLAPDMYVSMGKTAELVAQLTGTTREDQDLWALQSQRRAAAAMASGYIGGEVAPYRRSDGETIAEDDGPRPGTTIEGLSALTPAFLERGTVTAGNASPFNDGSSGAVVMSRQRADDLGIPVMARILGARASGLSPEIMGLGPVEASRRLLDRLGLGIGDIDVVELNEAFAAQVVPTVRQLGVDPDKVNPHGGAIAYGHPFGATGVRLVGTLARGLGALDGTLGLATLCVGGGQGMAMVIERER